MIKQMLKEVFTGPILIMLGFLALGFLIWVYTPWECETTHLGDNKYKTTCIITNE